MLISEVLQERGLTLWVVGDKLRVSPREKLTPEISDFIKEHKQDIIDELKSPVVYRNPYPEGTREARQESLMQIMEAICRDAVRTATEAHQASGKKYKSSVKMKLNEQSVDAAYQAVLTGKAELEDFRRVMDAWVRASIAALN